MVAKDLEHGRTGLGLLSLLLPLLQLPEHRRILQTQLYVEGHTDQDDAEQERYAPAPRRKRGLSHDRREYEEDAVPEDEPDGNPHLGEAPVEASLVLGGILRSQQDRRAHGQQRYDQGGLTTQLVPKVAE